MLHLNILTRQWRGQRTLLIALLTLPLGAPGVQAKKEPPLYPVVRLAPVVIEPQGALKEALSKEQEELVKSLETEAITQLEKQVVKRGLAASVVRTAGIQGAGTVSSAPLLSTSLRIPVAIAKDAHGLYATSHKSVFSIVKVQITAPDGAVLAAEEVALKCGDVLWTSGGRYRRVRPMPAVLNDFVRKGVIRVIKQLMQTQRNRA
jgi:hypothetical protein